MILFQNYLFTDLGDLLKSNIKNLTASCDASLNKCSKRYRTNMVFCRVSVASAPLNGCIPDNIMYKRMPRDQISVCGKQSSSSSTSGAKKLFKTYFKY